MSVYRSKLRYTRQAFSFTVAKKDSSDLTDAQAQILDAACKIAMRRKGRVGLIELAKASRRAASRIQDAIPILARKRFIRVLSHEAQHKIVVLRYTNGDPFPTFEPVSRTFRTLTPFLAEGTITNDDDAIEVLGTIAAGRPVEAITEPVLIHLPGLRTPPGHFWLRIRGGSLSGAGIQDGDLALIRRQPVPGPGGIAACLLDDGSTTLKLVVKGKRGKIELRPIADGYDTIEVPVVEVQGKLVATYHPCE